MNKKISINYKDITVPMMLYTSSETNSERCIIYFHGGGLIYGTIDDLPTPYIELFNNNGYNVISVGYPLAPESNLQDIKSSVHHSVLHIINNPESFGLNEDFEYVFFGRSSGAYLVLSETANLIKANNTFETEEHSAYRLPKAILSFYGYHGFDDPSFNKASEYFRKKALVDKTTMNNMLSDHILTEGSISKRYGIYVYSRQNGCWPHMLNASSETDTIDEALFSFFPPVFFTASNTDEDVPFKESKQMSRAVPNSLFIPVYYHEHDFDRDMTDPVGINVYKKAVSWLSGFFD